MTNEDLESALEATPTMNEALMGMPISNFKRNLARSTLSHFYLPRGILRTWEACICLKINGRGESRPLREYCTELSPDNRE